MKNKREYIISKINERWDLIWDVTEGMSGRHYDDKCEEEWENHLRQLHTYYDDLLETYKKKA